MFEKIKTAAFICICSFGSLFGQIRSDFVLVPNGVQPHILLDPQGRLHATWWDRGIYYGLFDSLGNSLQSYLISASSPSETPRLSISDQFFTVVWTSYSPGFYSHIVGVVANRENGVVIGEFENFDGNSGTPDVSYLTDSTFIAVWAREGPYAPYLVSRIYGQVFTNALSAVGDTLLFNDDLPDYNTHFHPRLAKTQEPGSTIVFWVAYDSLLGINVYGRRLTKEGTLESSSFVANDNSNYTKAWGLSAVMDVSGNFTVAWSAQVGDTSWNVYRRQFNSEGLPMNLSEQINVQAVVPFSEVDMAMDDDETHIIVWEGPPDKRKIVAQRFFADGAFVGTNFQVSLPTDTLIQASPSKIDPSFPNVIQFFKALESMYQDVTLYKQIPSAVWGDTIRISRRTGLAVKIHDMSQLFQLKFSQFVPIDSIIQNLGKLPEIEYAHQPIQAVLFATPNDPSYNSTNQWNLFKVNAAATWDITKGNSGVIVGIIDATGVNRNHVDFSVGGSSQFIANKGDLQFDGEHGTEVASVKIKCSNSRQSPTTIHSWQRV
jgi:hypothetical protein